MYPLDRPFENSSQFGAAWSRTEAWGARRKGLAVRQRLEIELQRPPVRG